MKPNVGIQQVFFSTAAVFGIGVHWLNFNKKVFTTVCHLVSAPFTWPDYGCEEAEDTYAKIVLDISQITGINT